MPINLSTVLRTLEVKYLSVYLQACSYCSLYLSGVCLADTEVKLTSYQSVLFKYSDKVKGKMQSTHKSNFIN